MKRGRAFTLIEMVISISIVSIIILGMGSALLIAIRALPDAGNAADATIAASEVAEQLAAELRFAVTFAERTAAIVEFTVADRNGDMASEVIRYAWSGSAGDPLTRQYNGGGIVDIVENVYELQFDHHIKTVTEEQQSHYYQTCIAITLQVGDNSTSRIDTAVNMLNTPEVPSP